MERSAGGVTPRACLRTGRDGNPPSRRCPWNISADRGTPRNLARSKAVLQDGTVLRGMPTPTACRKTAMERGLLRTGNNLTPIAPLLLILRICAPAPQPATLDPVQSRRRAGTHLHGMRTRQHLRRSVRAMVVLVEYPWLAAHAVPEIAHDQTPHRRWRFGRQRRREHRPPVAPRSVVRAPPPAPDRTGLLARRPTHRREVPAVSRVGRAHGTRRGPDRVATRVASRMGTRVGGLGHLGRHRPREPIEALTRQAGSRPQCDPDTGLGTSHPDRPILGTAIDTSLLEATFPVLPEQDDPT